MENTTEQIIIERNTQPDGKVTYSMNMPADTVIAYGMLHVALQTLQNKQAFYDNIRIVNEYDRNQVGGIVGINGKRIQ